MKKAIAFLVSLIMLTGLCAGAVSLSESKINADTASGSRYNRIIEFAKATFGNPGIEDRLSILFGTEGGMTDEKIEKMLSGYELFSRQDGFAKVNQTWKERFMSEIKDNNTIADALVMLSLFETLEKQPIDRYAVDALLVALLLIDYYDDDDLSDVDATLDNIDAMLAVRNAETESGD